MFAMWPKLAVPENGAFDRRFICRRGCERLGRRKDEFVGMLPAEAAGYPGFEFDVLGGIPLVDEGVGDEGLVEAEGEVAECRHFVPGVGIVEADGATVTG